MTALAQGSAGVALVLCFALLRTRRGNAATMLLLAQCAAATVTALALGRPVIAAAPLVSAGACWAVRQRSVTPGPLVSPAGGAGFGVLAGAVLTVLCQAQGSMAVPLAIVLLGVLLAATRPQPLLQLIALAVVQNGICLAGCYVEPDAWISLAGMLLPLPLAGVLTAGAPRPRWRMIPVLKARWLGWARCAVSLGVFAATLAMPLDPMATLFAPLFGFEGLLRAWSVRGRVAKAPSGHGRALIRLICTVLAVASLSPVVSWIAITGAFGSALLPALERRGTNTTMGFCAAGFALFGVLAVQTDAPGMGYPGMLIGYTVMAAMVPDLAAPLVVLILRQANSDTWTPVAAELASGIGVMGLLSCAILLRRLQDWHRPALLHLSQAAVGLLAIGLNTQDGRYGATILLILLTLTRAASRTGGGPVRLLALAGLSGIPPFGVFPALVLVTLAVCGHEPMMLIPLGAALAMMVTASLPACSRFGPDRSKWLTMAWLPLALASLIGFFTPDSLARWLRLLTAGSS